MAIPSNLIIVDYSRRLNKWIDINILSIFEEILRWKTKWIPSPNFKKENYRYVSEFFKNERKRGRKKIFQQFPINEIYDV